MRWDEMRCCSSTPVDIFLCSGRFLNSDGTVVVIPSSSYLPFGIGPRVCLGEALAKMEVFLVLSWILQRFSLSVPPECPLPSLEGKFGVVLQPAKYKVIATPRPGWEGKNPWPPQQLPFPRKRSINTRCYYIARWIIPDDCQWESTHQRCHLKGEHVLHLTSTRTPRTDFARTRQLKRRR